MSRSNLIIKVSDRTVGMSHPDKLLFKSKRHSKSDLIAYYQAVAKPMLQYACSRPISLVRFPEGYPGSSFFQRNRPSWTPHWIRHKKLGVEKKADYILFEDMATVAWLVNLSSLEIHCAQVKKPDYSKPDMLVFDLDPPKAFNFSELVNFAVEIKPLITSYGYSPFVKTSGKRGLHIFCPIKTKASFDEVFAAAEEIGRDITRKYAISTLEISKEKRKNRILIDIYRNHSYQSMIMPYSTRANDEATVSMPLSWRALKNCSTPQVFRLDNVPEIVKARKDPWSKMSSSAVPLHAYEIQ